MASKINFYSFARKTYSKKIKILYSLLFFAILSISSYYGIYFFRKECLYSDLYIKKIREFGCNLDDQDIFSRRYDVEILFISNPPHDQIYAYIKKLKNYYYLEGVGADELLSDTDTVNIKSKNFFPEDGLSFRIKNISMEWFVLNKCHWGNDIFFSTKYIREN